PDAAPRDLHAFPTRRSSDLSPGTVALSRFGGVKKVSPRFLERVAVTPGKSVRLVNATFGMAELFGSGAFTAMSASPPPGATPRLDRKSTRLNSSHRTISYAV